MKRAAIVLLLLVLSCKKDEQGTAAGTKVLNWARAGYSGNTVVDVGPDVTDVRELAVQFAGEPPVHVSLRITHGPADVTYKDASVAKREVPRRMEATLTEALPFALAVTCSPEVSGPAERNPNALYTICEISGPSAKESVPRRAVVIVFGDGVVVNETATTSKVMVTNGK